MENQIPATQLQLQAFSSRLGKIFFNVAIVSLVLCILGLFTFGIAALLFLIGVVVTIYTVGFIFVIAPNFWSTIMAGTEFTAQIADFFTQYWYIFVAITIVLSVASIVLLALDRQRKHTVKIVFASIIIAIALFVMVVVLAWR